MLGKYENRRINAPFSLSLWRYWDEKKKVSILSQMKQNLLWLVLFGSILKIAYHTGSVQTIREHMQLKFEYPRKVNANCYECKLFQFFQLIYLLKSKYHVCIITTVLRGLNLKNVQILIEFLFSKFNHCRY